MKTPKPQSKPPRPHLVAAAALAVGLLSLAPLAPAQAFTRLAISINAAPPPPRVLPPPPPPRAHMVWAPGYWRWNGRSHVWVDGRYLDERPGYVWIPEHWVQRGPNYRFVEGHWRRA